MGAGTDTSDISATDLLVTRAGPSNLSVRDSTNGVETFIFSSSVGGIMGTVTNDPLNIKTNNASAIFIDASQNVGIGDVTPTYNLDVTGFARFTGLVDASHFVATSTTATSTFPNIQATQALFGGDFITDFTGTNLSVNAAGVLSAAGGAGADHTYPFPNAGNATSTEVGLFGGFLSTASSTVDSTLIVTGTLTGASGTWDSGGFDIAASDSYAVAGTDILADSAGTLTLRNVDALGATTETTVEAAIDALANLTTFGGGTATTTSAGGLKIDLLTLQIDSLTGALLMTDSDGTLLEYAGTGTCSNQFMTALSVLGVFTCETVSLTADVSGVLPLANGGTASTTIKVWSVTVASTSPAFIDGGLLPIPVEFQAYTMTDIVCKVDGGTSKIIAIEDASANSTEDITCATSPTQDDGSITNASATSLEEMFIDFGAGSGTVDYVTITVYK